MKFSICTLSVLALCTISGAVTIPRVTHDSIAEKTDRIVSPFLERAIQPTPITQAVTPPNTASISTPTPATTSSNAPTPTPTGRTPIKDHELGRVFMFVGIGLGAFTVIAMIGGAVAGMRWMAQTKKSNDIHYRKADETLHFLQQRRGRGRNEGSVPTLPSMHLMPSMQVPSVDSMPPPARLSKPPRVASRI